MAAEDLLSRTDAFTSSGDALDEVFRARLIAAVGAARARAAAAGDRALDAPAGVDSASCPTSSAESYPPRRHAAVLSRPRRAGHRRNGPRRRTPTGRDLPTRARTLDHPSLRYLVHLNAPGWNVIGATAPWHPGVAAGHNDRIALDRRADRRRHPGHLCREAEPGQPAQVEDGGRWVDIDARKDFIAVRGRKTPVDFTRETTRHGVIVASDLERHLAFALRWSGSEPGTAAELAAPATRSRRVGDGVSSRARALEDAGAAMTLIDARRHARVAIAGLVPVRRGWSGALPVPGWTGATEWRGWTTRTGAGPRGCRSPRAPARAA